MIVEYLRVHVTKPRMALCLYIVEAVAVYFIDGIWPGQHPAWLILLVQRKPELLAFLAANLILVAVLLNTNYADGLNVGKVALITGALVGFVATLEFLSSPNLIETLVVASVLIPLFMALGASIPFFWHLSLGAALSVIVGLSVGVVSASVTGEVNTLVEAVVVFSMVLTASGTVFFLARRQQSRRCASSRHSKILSGSQDTPDPGSEEKASVWQNAVDDSSDQFLLISRGEEEYPSDYYGHLMEQYKIYAEMTDRISQRRQTAHTLFLTINTGLIALLGLALSGKLGIVGSVWISVVAVAGIILSWAWYRLVKSYGDLNAGKFRVIHRIEELLPIKPYKAEWEIVGYGQDFSLFKPFTETEVFIPWVFILLYSVLVVLSFFN